MLPSCSRRPTCQTPYKRSLFPANIYTIIICIYTVYRMRQKTFLANRVLIENDHVHPSGLYCPLSAVIVLLVCDVVGHFRQSALVVPSGDEMLVEYGGVHLGLAGMEADLHRSRRCRCFHRSLSLRHWAHV